MSGSINERYDIVFAGGGTTACLIAGRLAKADPSLRILLLEAGPLTREIQEHIQPGRYMFHQKPTSKTLTFNVANPSADVAGRSLAIPCGRCVGGGSSVNFTMYTRAAASDYDDWEQVYGNVGWGSKDLIPLLKKTETYQVKPGEPNHGYNGPLKVSWGGHYTNVGKEFLDMAAKYDQERGHVEDVNGLFSCNEYGAWPKWIDGKTGMRSDVPHHFIYNQEDNKNLVLRPGSRVKRIIIENNRAVGVEYVNDTVIDPEADQTLRTVHASRLIVVSGGAFGSPTILERSGIGSKSLIEKAGIKSIVDLPGVGEGYQDHNVACVPYLASEEAETHDAIFREDEEELRKWNDLWLKEGKGLLANNSFDAGIKIRPTEEDLKELGPAFEGTWSSHFANATDKPILWIGSISAYIGDMSLTTKRKYYCVGYYTEYPEARGNVHIKSDDPHDLPSVNPNFLDNASDIALVRWGYKKSREFARRMRFYRGELVAAHPKFREGNETLCKEVDGPVDVSVPNITYTAEDDNAIEEYNRNFIQTLWHSLGTCAMKPREDGGVVDSYLNVYGIEGLKVADMSIAPGNVGSNTYSTALVIGEKAALIIADELGIKAIV